MLRHVLIVAMLLVSVFGAEDKKVDDWDLNITQNADKRVLMKGKKGFIYSVTVAAAPMAKVRTLGLSVGGAKDANNFYENIKRGYLPKVESITYEGVFYEHYFDIKSSSCKNLFCPNYMTARVLNPFSQKGEEFLLVGLDSNIDMSKFKRDRLNLVIVLDISGSMSSPFDSYYYDKMGNRIRNEEGREPKIEVATKTIVNLINHLNGSDSLGVVLFNHNAYRAKPLRSIATTDIEAIKKHILDLKARGGTNWSAGYKKALELFENYENSGAQNRIIFITDAMPNRGELRKEGLLGLAKKASEKGIYTTFIGVGVDFNNNLVEAVSKTRGANYYSVHSAKEFKKRLDKEFEYMVTPLVFDLKLTLRSPSYKIAAVYGSPEAKRATGEIMFVNTLFPTPTDESGAKGGVVLLKLKKLSHNGGDIALNVEYKDRAGKIHKVSKRVSFKEGLYSEGKAVSKAILLARYTDLIKNFLIDSAKACNSKPYPPIPILKKHCLAFPPDREDYRYVSTWERKSCKLRVSEGYKKIFEMFKNYYKREAEKIGDSSLNKELKLLNKLTDTPSSSGKLDDWQFNR